MTAGSEASFRRASVLGEMGFEKEWSNPSFDHRSSFLESKGFTLVTETLLGSEALTVMTLPAESATASATASESVSDNDSERDDAEEEDDF